MEKLDTLHYDDFKYIDGYGKTVNFIISPRWDGKSTAFIMKKAYPAFKKRKAVTIVQRRKVVSITDEYIQSFAGIINKFTDDKVKFSYKQGDKKEGIVNVYVGNDKFLVFVGISKDLQDLKSLFISNVAYYFCDEFICNPKLGERYERGEAFKFKEFLNTVIRENQKIRCYFMGNPYSLYNPYFVEYGVDTNSLSGALDSVNAPHGIIQVGDVWLVQRHPLKTELAEWLKDNNPLYKDDDAYTSYALAGSSVNDANIPLLAKQPANFRLRWIFAIDGAQVGIFQNQDFLNRDFKYWASKVDGFSKDRSVFVFDFAALTSGAILFSATERMRFAHIREAIRNRQIAYSSIEVAYSLREIYTYL